MTESRRAGVLRNAGLQLSYRRTCPNFADDNFNVSLSFINQKLVLGVNLRDRKTECADSSNNSKLLYGDVSVYRLTVPSLNSSKTLGVI
jgi:hypothetical protein